MPEAHIPPRHKGRIKEMRVGEKIGGEGGPLGTERGGFYRVWQLMTWKHYRVGRSSNLGFGGAVWDQGGTSDDGKKEANERPRKENVSLFRKNTVFLDFPESAVRGGQVEGTRPLLSRPSSRMTA